VETKQETKPFPSDEMNRLLANHAAQGNGMETTKGNELAVLLAVGFQSRSIIQRLTGTRFIGWRLKAILDQ
jgi:hypothetical protein